VITEASGGIAGVTEIAGTALETTVLFELSLRETTVASFRVCAGTAVANTKINKDRTRMR
jgi:hypothetical protein